MNVELSAGKKSAIARLHPNRIPANAKYGSMSSYVSFNICTSTTTVQSERIPITKVFQPIQLFYAALGNLQKIDLFLSQQVCKFAIADPCKNRKDGPPSV